MKLKFPLFWLLVNVSTLFAYDVASPKRIKNIDFFYLINLDERPEKYEKTVREFRPYGILPLRISAVNGWKLTIQEINTVGVQFQSWMQGGRKATYYSEVDGEAHHEVIGKIGRTYFSHHMSRGAIGCVLSHCHVLKQAYLAGYETIWIIEDDVKVDKDPHILSELIEALDKSLGSEEWDILFTDRDFKNRKGQHVPCNDCGWRPNFKPAPLAHFGKKIQINHQFRRIGARFGSHSMILRRSGIEKLLDFYEKHQIFLPYDEDYTLPETIQLYTVLDDVVSNIPGAISDNVTPPPK